MDPRTTRSRSNTPDSGDGVGERLLAVSSRDQLLLAVSSGELDPAFFAAGLIVRTSASTSCPQESAPTQSTASAPAAPPRRNGSSSRTASSGRPPLPRQPEGMRQTFGGWVYALTHHEPTPEENLAVTTIIFGRQARTLFDTSASHFFVSAYFITTHGFTVQPN